MNANLSVLVISGFGRASAVTNEVMRTAIQHLERLGVNTKAQNLFHLSLPQFDGETPWSVVPPSVKELLHDIRSRHGLVIVAPEYHGGIGSLLKNAIDWVAMAYSQQDHHRLLLDHKPSALITVSRERNLGIHALSQMGALCHALGSPVMPGSMGIFDHPNTISADGGFSEIAVTRRLEALMADLIKVAQQVALL